ncbi:hypothetical protein KKC63_03180 [Patescibacteria group bacterium]|nr:hypothetical protein [Patescibacteria group bacterium]
MKEKLATILKWFSKIWSFLVVLSIFVGAVGIIIFDGWSKFTEIFSPFNLLNYLLILVLLLPAIGAYYLSERFLKSKD